jgi:hypothetical protein
MRPPTPGVPSLAIRRSYSNERYPVEKVTDPVNRSGSPGTLPTRTYGIVPRVVACLSRCPRTEAELMSW